MGLEFAALAGLGLQEACISGFRNLGSGGLEFGAVGVWGSGAWSSGFGVAGV